MKMLKPIRLLVFFIATIALAKFFEAGRLIANEQTFNHVPLSFFSLLTLVLSFFVLGYWIYEDEKKKNNLRINFSLYEWIYKKLNSVVIARSPSHALGINSATKQSPLRNVMRLLRRLFEPPRNDTEGVK